MFQTANGSTSTSDVAEIVVDELDEAVKPHVLDESPTVLSIGRRCMRMGYAFHWMPGKQPFMVTPKQGFVHLQVKDDIPYLVSDGKLRSNRHRPTIDDLKGHFSEVLALVTNDEPDQNDDDENDIPAAAGEPAEVESEHHHGAVDFGPPGGAGPVHPPPVAEEHQRTSGWTHVTMVTPRPMKKKLMRMIQMLVLRLTCTKDHRSRGKWESSRRTPTSIADLLTHRYRNPCCESCLKAKMRHFRSRTGAFKKRGQDIRGPGDVRLRDGIGRS